MQRGAFESGIHSVQVSAARQQQRSRLDRAALRSDDQWRLCLHIAGVRVCAET
jgi:hypothetical protein